MLEGEENHEAAGPRWEGLGHSSRASELVDELYIMPGCVATWPAGGQSRLAAAAAAAAAASHWSISLRDWECNAYPDTQHESVRDVSSNLGYD